MSHRLLDPNNEHDVALAFDVSRKTKPKGDLLVLSQAEYFSRPTGSCTHPCYWPCFTTCEPLISNEESDT